MSQTPPNLVRFAPRQKRSVRGQLDSIFQNSRGHSVQSHALATKAEASTRRNLAYRAQKNLLKWRCPARNINIGVNPMARLTPRKEPAPATSAVKFDCPALNIPPLDESRRGRNHRARQNKDQTFLPSQESQTSSEEYRTTGSRCIFFASSGTDTTRPNAVTFLR